MEAHAVDLADVCRSTSFLGVLCADVDGPFVTLQIRGAGLNWLCRAGYAKVLEATLAAIRADSDEERPEVVRRAVDWVARRQLAARAEMLASLFSPELLQALPAGFVSVFGQAHTAAFWERVLVAEATQLSDSKCLRTISHSGPRLVSFGY